MTISKRKNIKSLLLAATMFMSPMILVAAPPAVAQVGISVQVAPPILPIYAQPPIPEEGYIWTPGYWGANEAGGYYWIPGTWVRPPSIGVLWTPPYWGWGGGGYLFHAGYWGAHVGFYGGINYGFGYGGFGYEGGRWEGNGFVYNRSANNFGSVHVANTYDRKVTVVNNSRVAYVGGKGGLTAEPRAEDRLAEKDNHVDRTDEQARHASAAASNRELAASRNHGNPAIAATQRPGELTGPGVVRTQHVAAHATQGTRLGSATQRPPEHAAPRTAEAHRAAPAADAEHRAPHPAIAHQAAHPAEAKPEHPAAAHQAAPATAPVRQAAEKGKEETMAR